MAIKDRIHEELTTPMSRKEFLGQAGAFLLAVIGFNSIMYALGSISNVPTDKRAFSAVSSGYGFSVYGGKRNQQQFASMESNFSGVHAVFAN
jgi:hypothetical protein